MQAVTRVGQVHLSRFMGTSEATTSRLLSEHLEKFCDLIVACELKVVSIDMKCYRSEDIDPYIKLAKQHMAKVIGVESLEWEE